MEIPSVTFGEAGTPGLLFPVGLADPAPFSGVGQTVFPPMGSGDPSHMFPAYVPEPEKLIWNYVNDLTQWRVQFPEEFEGGLSLPTSFALAPSIDAQYGVSIPVLRGWPAFPTQVPGIGVALGNESEDTGEDGIAAGFAGDVAWQDEQGNTLAWASYYSEPIYSTTIVELVHENRDERDRLHGELRRYLFPLRRLLPIIEPLIRRTQVDAEKHEIDATEVPMTVYASVFTIHTWFEMLVPGDVVLSGGDGAMINAIDVETVIEDPNDIAEDPEDG